MKRFNNIFNHRQSAGAKQDEYQPRMCHAELDLASTFFTDSFSCKYLAECGQRKAVSVMRFALGVLSDLCLLFPTLLYSQVDTTWVKRYNGPGIFSEDANAIAVNGAGNVYVTDSSYDSGTYDDYVLIINNSSKN